MAPHPPVLTAKGRGAVISMAPGAEFKDFGRALITLTAHNWLHPLPWTSRLAILACSMLLPDFSLPTMLQTTPSLLLLTPKAFH